MKVYKVLFSLMIYW